jgi:hypothetical protein
LAKIGENRSNCWSEYRPQAYKCSAYLVTYIHTYLLKSISFENPRFDTILQNQWSVFSWVDGSSRARCPTWVLWYIHTFLVLGYVWYSVCRAAKCRNPNCRITYYCSQT